MKQFSRPIVINKIKTYITQNIKERSSSILRLWSNQCEYIIAQRFRRGQQMISLYSKMWDDTAFKELIKCFQKQFQRHAKGMILGSTGLFLFDWDKERISLDSMSVYMNELDEIQKLKLNTIECQNCEKRTLFDNKIDNIEYCTCTVTKKVSNINVSEWIPYLERKNMIIWRREEKPGLYAYKVYVHYNDITAEDFLYVQTNIDYRKQWDNTAISLDLIDSDVQTNSNIIYWEMLWPKLFANRDYVFARRYVIDEENNIIIVVNKSVQHPMCPVKSQNHRVDEYWSYMVIKPKSNYKNLGLEFVLTYFDNPGISLPATVTSWVAHSQMPEYLNRLYDATKIYSERRRNEHKNLKSLEKYSDPDYEYSQQAYEEEDKDDTNNSTLPDEQQESPEAQISSRRSSWWSYLHPYSYFA